MTCGKCGIMKFNAKINYTIDDKHPDIKYIKEWTKEKVFTFEDMYSFDNNYEWTTESAICHIKNDLKLCAGGGYDTKHIHNVTFNISII